MVVYQRVHDEILQALKDNVYPVGTLLPPEPELERIYSVSRTTVRRATLPSFLKKGMYRYDRATELWF